MIRFGAIKVNRLHVQPKQDELTVNMDFELTGKDQTTFKSLLGRNTVLKKPNNVLGIRYYHAKGRPSPVFYALATHTERDFGQTAFEKQQDARHQKLINKIEKELGYKIEKDESDTTDFQPPQGFVFDEKHQVNLRSKKEAEAFQGFLSRLSEVLSPQWVTFLEKAHHQTHKP